MIFVIDDEPTMAKCIEKGSKKECMVFSNAIDAMNKISDGIIPELIFLDVLLDGPDGFTFLNELVSYSDTERIPIVIVSSLNFQDKDFSEYGVVGVLNKEVMKPQDIENYAGEYAA